ncbi:MAG: hypothetical protein GY817_06005 [bacterium]|nr:hypothetical protein [bacterium]
MIDVSQHIVNDEKMIFCLQENVNKNLKINGVFLVTDQLNNKKFNFYEIARNMKFYTDVLKLKVLHKPILFRDKYIFSFIKK